MYACIYRYACMCMHACVCVSFLTSLCGVGSDTQHSLRSIQEVAGVVEGMEAHYVSTCHRLHR